MANENRNLDRNPNGAQGDTGKTAITPRKHHEVLSTEVPRHTVEEITGVVRPLVDASTQMTKFLLAGKDPAPRVRVKPWSLEKTVYVTGMINIQENYTVKLGQVADVPEMKYGVAAAEVLGPAIKVVEGGLNALKEAFAALTKPALTGAENVYNRAVAASRTNGSIADAMAPYREARLKAAKKAQKTRKSKAQQKAAPGPMPAKEEPTPTPTGPTTVTTTTKL